MKKRCFRQTFAAFAFLALLGPATSLSAHMAWLATDKDGHAILWFGESVEDRAYAMPDAIAAMTLSADGDAVVTESLKTDDFIGLRSSDKTTSTDELSGTAVYGLYHGMKLTYHVEHLPHDNPTDWPKSPRTGALLQTVITPSTAEDGGVDVVVLKNGKPAADLVVKLYCDEGHEEGEATTDAQGRVSFDAGQVESGLNAVMVGVRNENAAGELDGQSYKSASDYLTATFFYPAAEKDERVSRSPEPGSDSAAMTEPKVDTENQVPVVASKLADLPEELTSFGAAIAGETLYVYGGHTGSAHSYSRDEQSNRLWSLDLSEDQATWQTASTDDHLQGLALLGWKDRVIRIGGFTAVNEEGEDHNLQSQKRVTMFDPATKSWTDLAPLPEPRSSLDAAVLGDSIYVFGGWELAGDSVETTWHKTAYALDLSDAEATWQKLATPPFQRRANSVAAFNGKLYVIGGMKSEGGPTTCVDVYDPATDTWSSAASLPGKGMSGFGSSAFAVGDALYVSTMDGFVHKLAAGDQQWTTVAESDPARFFHRMIPWNGNLLMIGGANMQIGKFTEIEMVKLN